MSKRLTADFSSDYGSQKVVCDILKVLKENSKKPINPGSSDLQSSNMRKRLRLFEINKS